VNYLAKKVELTEMPVAKSQPEYFHIGIDNAMHPAKSLSQMLGVSPRWIAHRLDLSHSLYRQLQLTEDAGRRPPNVQPEVSEKLVMTWGLDPWEFWRNRCLWSILRYEVNLAWFAVWNSTVDADEMAIGSKALTKLPDPLRWSSRLAIRCQIARERYLWLQAEAMTKAVAAHTAKEPDENLHHYDSEQFPLENFLGPLRRNQPVEDQPGFQALVKCLQASCPAYIPTATQLFRTSRQLNLETVRIWCWEAPISQN
jgi:hypothetical protein